MKVLLVHPDSARNIGAEDPSVKFAEKKAYLPPLALITVAALLPQDWAFKLADLSFQKISDQDWDECDLVLVSGTIVQLKGIAEAVTEAKRRGKLVAVGGPGVFHFPQDILDAGADFAVKGEGELTIPILLDCLERKDYGRLIEVTGQADITKSPVPRFDLLERDSYIDLTMQFSRGCPFRCEFCDVTSIYGRSLRTKTPEQVLNELQALYDLNWRGQILFVDDNFVGAPLKAKALLKELIPWMDSHNRPFEFFTCTSLNLAGFPDIMNLMVRAGFTRALLGIETTDKGPLKISKKFHNAAMDADAACSKISRSGLQIIALLMVGFDGEEPGRDLRVIEFAERNDIPELIVTLVHAFPGTEMWDRLNGENRLLAADAYDSGDWKALQMNFIPKRPEMEIVREFVNIHKALYDPEKFWNRTFQHLTRMDPPPVKLPYRLPNAYECRMLLKLGMKWGVRSPLRWKFWRTGLTAVLRLTRERFALYVRACITLDRYVLFCRELTEQLEEKLAAEESQREAVMEKESEACSTRQGIRA